MGLWYLVLFYPIGVRELVFELLSFLIFLKVAGKYVNHPQKELTKQITFFASDSPLRRLVETF